MNCSTDGVGMENCSMGLFFFWSDRLHSWKSPSRLKVGVKFSFQVRQKQRRSKNSPPTPGFYSLQHYSALIMPILFTFTKDAALLTSPIWSAMKESHPYTDTPFFPPPPILCVPMRAISFHTRLGPSAPTKQCGRFLRAGCSRKSLLCPGEEAGFQNAPLLFIQASTCVTRARYKRIHLVTPWCLEQSRAEPSGQWTNSLHQRKRLTPFMDSAALQQCDVIWAPFKANTRNSEGFLFSVLMRGWKCFTMKVAYNREGEGGCCGLSVILQDRLVAHGPAQRDTATVDRRREPRGRGLRRCWVIAAL